MPYGKPGEPLSKPNLTIFFPIAESFEFNSIYLNRCIVYYWYNFKAKRLFFCAFIGTLAITMAYAWRNWFDENSKWILLIILCICKQKWFLWTIKIALLMSLISCIIVFLIFDCVIHEPCSLVFFRIQNQIKSRQKL